MNKPEQPDGDNADKATWDALTRAGWWKDDKQIVVCTGEKLYCDPPMTPAGALITVEVLEDPCLKK